MIISKAKHIHAVNQSIYSKKIKVPKRKYILPKIIRVFGLSLAMIIFSYQTFLLYSQYATNKIKIELGSRRVGEIQTPNFSFCFKLFPDSNEQVSTRSSTAQYSSWRIQDIVRDVKDKSDTATTSQLLHSAGSLSSIISKCYIRLSNLTVTECSRFSWAKSILSKKLCMTLEYNEIFDQKDVILEAFDDSPLVFVRFNLTSFKMHNEFVMVAHESTSVPWFPDPNFFYINIKKNYNLYSFSFSKVIVQNLPKPYHDNCRVRPGNFDDVSQCYDNCLVKQFTKIVGAYPREYTVKNGDNFKLIANYTQEVKYNDLSYQLYRSCLPLCGHTDCILTKYRLNQRKEYHLDSSSDKTLDIQVYPSPLIVVIKYRKPVISDSNFISSLGGLIGLWFGVSFCSLFNSMSNICNKMIRSRNKVEPALIARKQRVKRNRTVNKFEPLGSFPKKHYLALVGEMSSNRTRFQLNSGSRINFHDQVDKH
ncbi:uncharacterized protein LOC112539574 [Tetranychus urticae]|uniref:Uncharacterized protein n=1 Tax=Tetranychus urticae TaxID=32264 RepID=T1L0H2_TETUR|nr:uncharacterized protein LOC112539574 [Tetranychus urticae]